MLNSPKSQGKSKLVKNFHHLSLDSPYSDFPRSSSVSPHKFIKEKTKQIKNLTVGLDIPDQEKLKRHFVTSPSNKRSKTPSKSQRFHEAFKEKALRVIKEMPKKSDMPKKTLRYSNISEIPEEFITISFTSLDSTPITDIEEPKYKNQTAKTLFINDKRNISPRNNSPVKPKIEPRIEKPPTRRSVSKAQEEPITYDPITTSLKSQEVLANKFVKEYENAVQNLNLQSEDIDFINSVALLTVLGFINNDPGSLTYDKEMHLVNKLWKSLGGMVTIKVPSLLTMCLHIMNLYKANSYFTDEKCASIKTWTVIHGIHVYSHEEALKIHKKYFEFYQNRSLGKKTTKNIEKNEESLLKMDRKSMFTNKSKSVSIKDEPVENANKKDRKFVNSPTAFRKSLNSPNKFSMMLYKNNEEKHKDFYPDTEKSKVKEQTEGFYSEKVQKEIKRMRNYREQKAKKNESLMNKSHKKNSSYFEEVTTELLHVKNNSLISPVNMLKLIRNPSRSKSSFCERKPHDQSINKLDHNVYSKDYNKKENAFSNRIANKFLNYLSEKKSIENLSVSINQNAKRSHKNSPRNIHHMKLLPYEKTNEKNIISKETSDQDYHPSDMQVLPNNLSNEIHTYKDTTSISNSLKDKIMDNESCENIKSADCDDKLNIINNSKFLKTPDSSIVNSEININYTPEEAKTIEKSQNFLQFEHNPKPQTNQNLLAENPEKLLCSIDVMDIEQKH